MLLMITMLLMMSMTFSKKQVGQIQRSGNSSLSNTINCQRPVRLLVLFVGGQVVRQGDPIVADNIEFD